MGMVGVVYGYIVRNLRKPKKNFCLSIGLDLSFVWKNLDRGMLKRLTEVIGTSIGNIGDSLFEARRS